jgi:Amt family ammonium transporter
VIGAFIYYLIGFALQSNQNGGIIGQGNFAGSHLSKPRDYLELIFYFGFCGTSTTIVSGALAERVHVDTYIFYSVIMTGFISPIALGWAWGGGWLQDLGFHDFCGSGVVHLVGGTACFWGTYLLGPRLGRFPSKDNDHSSVTNYEAKRYD